MNIGPAEIIIVLVIALLVFGPKRLPQMGRQLGRGVREFRRAAETARTELGLDGVIEDVNAVKDEVTSALGIDEIKATITGVTDDLGVNELKAGIEDVKSSMGVEEISAGIGSVKSAMSFDVRGAAKSAVTGKGAKKSAAADTSADATEAAPEPEITPFQDVEASPVAAPDAVPEAPVAAPDAPAAPAGVDA